MKGKLTRREFVRIAAAGGLLAASTPSQLLAALETAEPAADIAAVKGPAALSVRAAVDAVGGMGAFVKPGSRVVLKPNMGFPTPPDQGATTNPVVVAETAKMCAEAGAASILIIDHPVRKASVCLELNGIRDACAGLPKTRVVAVDRKEFFEEIEIPGGKVLHKAEVISEVLRADAFINMPIAKSHSGANVSFGLKNLMGVVWNRKVFHFPLNLSEAIADLATALRAHLTIVDASRTLLDGGPQGPGTVEAADTIVAGIDPLAVDAFTVGLAQWYGKTWRPQDIKHLAAAAERGIGKIDIGPLRIKQIDRS